MTRTVCHGDRPADRRCELHGAQLQGAASPLQTVFALQMKDAKDKEGGKNKIKPCDFKELGKESYWW